MAASCCTLASVSVVNSWRSLPWNLLTRDSRNVLIPPISLLSCKLSPCWFHSLFVCLSHFLSVYSWHVQAEPHSTLPFLPFPFFFPMHTHAEGAGRAQRYAHRHDTLLLTQRPMQTMGESHVAKWESRGGQWDTPAFCSFTYTLAFTYKYINTYTRLCCHDSGFSLIWAWCLSHAETVH